MLDHADKKAGIDPNRVTPTASTTVINGASSTATTTVGTPGSVTTAPTNVTSTVPASAQSPSVAESLLGALTGTSVAGTWLLLSFLAGNIKYVVLIGGEP